MVYLCAMVKGYLPPQAGVSFNYINIYTLYYISLIVLSLIYTHAIRLHREHIYLFVYLLYLYMICDYVSLLIFIMIFKLILGYTYQPQIDHVHTHCISYIIQEYAKSIKNQVHLEQTLGFSFKKIGNVFLLRNWEVFFMGTFFRTNLL